MRIKSLILALIMMFSLTVSTALAEEQKVSHDENVVSFLTDLGVIEGDRDKEDTVTRGEFLKYVTDALMINTEGDIDGTFTDVDKSHIYAKEIYTAKLMGIVSGAQSSRFMPDSPITYNAAIKILVSALGYKNTSEAYGGYPIGYTLVAGDIELSKNVPAKGEGNLNFGDVCKLLYNFLNADLCEVVAVSGENSTEQRQNGKTLLYEKYNLEYVDGIIKSAGFISSSPDFMSDAPVMEIGGDVYKTDISDAEQYIGLSVRAYKDRESGEIRAVYVKSQNMIYTLSASDVVSYADFTLEAEGGNQKKNDVYNFDRGFYYIKNGRTSRNVEFLFDNGNIKLIDNNRDNLIDFAVVEKYDYMVVSSISTAEDGVYDIKAGKKLYMREGAGFYYSLTIDGESRKYDYLANGTVLTVIKSDDSRFVKAIGCTKSVKGKIDEIGEDTLIIDGTEYKTNKYFCDNANVTVGMEGEFLFSHDGYITAVKDSGKSEMRYAYLIGYLEKKSGLKQDVQVQFLDQGGQYFVYSLADKITLDGESVKKSDFAVREALSNGEYPKYQVFKYALDGNNNINTIDTAQEVDIKLNANERYSASYSGDNTLTRFVKNKNSYYEKTYNTFLPYTTVKSDTIIFSIPKGIADSENQDTTKADERQRFYDKKYFSVFSTSVLSGRVKLLCDVYDQNQYLQPGVVVLYNNNLSVNSSVNDDAVPRVVDSVVDAVDDEGMISKKLTILSGNTYVSYFMDKELCDGLGEEGMPQSGDVVRLSVNSAGELSGLKVDARFDFKTGKPKIINQAKDQVYYPYYVGKVFSHNTSTMALMVDEGPYMEPYYSDDTDDGVVSFTLSSSITCIRYDAVRKTAIPVRSTDIEDALSVGRDGASTVLVNSLTHNIRVLVEYVTE